MNCQNPDCYLAGSEHEHMMDKPATPEEVKPQLSVDDVRSIAESAARKVMKYWLDDFMQTHGDSKSHTSKKAVLETVAYSLSHFADDTSVPGILGLE